MAYIQIPAFLKTTDIQSETEFVIVFQGKEYLIKFKDLLYKLSNNQQLSELIQQEIELINSEIEDINLEILELKENQNRILIPLKITDETPTQNGIYLPVEDGLYPNGLVKNSENGFEIFVLSDGQWTKETYPISITATGEIKLGDIRPVSGDAVEKYAIKKINTVSELMTVYGDYEGQIITLLGYYEAGDKEPLNYKYTSTQGVDDGGSVINTENGSWEAIFNSTVSVKHFGASNNLNNNLDIIQKAINSENHILIDEDLDLQIQITQTPLNNETPKNGIQLLDSTNIVLNGKIRLNTCDFNAYDIIGAYDCNNISITGKGEIIGDVVSHVSDAGEHGMGILIYDCNNVVIEGIKVSKCFADGLILHGKASNISEDLNKNIFVRNVTFEDNRRQGVSILKCDFAVFTDCTFKDTGKTKFTLPACGVDIEPEWYQEAKNVKFDKCLFTGNASMGLFIHSNDHTKNIENVSVNNCIFESDYSVDAGGRSLIGVSKAILDEFSYVKNISILNNVFNVRDYNRNIIDISNNIKNVKIVGNNFLDDKNTTYNFNINCISISQVTGCSIVNNTTNVGYNFVFFQGNITSDISITDNDIRNITNISILGGYGAKSVSIINNNFNTCEYGIRLTSGCNDVIIDSNMFNDLQKYAIYADYGIFIVNINNNIFKRICTGNSSVSYERNIISLYGDPVDKVSGLNISNNIFDNNTITTPYYYIGRNLSNIDYYIFSNNIFHNDTNHGSKVDLINEPNKIVNLGLAKLNTVGFVKSSTNVANITTSDATDLSTALALVNELKAKLNAKLTADRNSGQQSTT